MPIVSIDFGTNRCSIVVDREGKLELVKDIESDTPFILPYVTHGPTGWIIGDKASRTQQTNASNVVFALKQLLCANTKDLSRQIPSWPFDVITEQNEIAVKLGRNVFTAKELVQILFHTFLQWAEKRLGEPSTELILNVSPQIDEKVREELQEAALIGGAKVVHVIDDQMAAALVYNYLRSCKDTIKLLIVSQGSNCLTASIFQLSEEDPTQLGFVIDEEFGGDCYDRTLKSHVIDQFCKEHKHTWAGNRLTDHVLLQSCKQAKHELTKHIKTQLAVPEICQGLSIKQTYNRQSFEIICQQLLNRPVITLNSLLEQTNVQKNEIAEVMLVGGATRVPKLRHLIHNYFEGKVTVSTNFAFDHVFACGSALYLANLKNLKITDLPEESFWKDDIYTEQSEDKVLHNSFVLEPIGFRITGMPAVTMFKPGENIPNRREYTISTTADFQTPSLLHIWSGGDLDGNITDADIVTCVVCPEVPPTPKGTPILLTIFEIDMNGRLIVTVKLTCSEMSKTEIIPNLVTFDWYNTRTIRRLDRCNSQLQCDIRNIARTLGCSNAKNRLSAEQITTVKQKCDSINLWLSTSKQMTVQHLDAKRKDLFNTWMSYVPLLYPES